MKTPMQEKFGELWMEAAGAFESYALSPEYGIATKLLLAYFKENGYEIEKTNIMNVSDMCNFFDIKEEDIKLEKDYWEGIADEGGTHGFTLNGYKWMSDISPMEGYSFIDKNMLLKSNE